MQINHYNFKHQMKNENIITDDAKPGDVQVAAAFKDAIYFQAMVNYDKELTKLTENINEYEYSDLLHEIEI